MRVAQDSYLADITPSAAIRAFIGILAPPAAVMLEELRSDPDLLALPVRWLMPAGLHLTLAFLGETAGTELLDLWPKVLPVLARLRPLPLRLDRPRLFPDVQRPRLVAAGVEGDRAGLMAIHGAVGDVLRREGYELDSRPYQPHVSLGRLRLPLLRGQPAALAAALQARTWPGSDAFVARAVYLMRSDLFPDGARYTALAEAMLDGRA